MANDTLKGRDYVMEIDTTTAITADRGSDANYNAILCEVSSEFSIDTDTTTPTANKCTARGGWANEEPNTSTWSFTGEFQAIDPATGDPSAVSMNDIAALAASKQKFWARRVLAESGGVEVVREGVVWISAYSDTASTEDEFTFTATFSGVGEPLITAATGG